MEWSSDPFGRTGGGTQFDSRLARAISPRLVLWLGKSPCGSAHTHSLFLIHTFSIFDTEQPSGLMLGPGLEEWWRYPVPFLGCASHFFGACWEGVFFDFYKCWGMWGTLLREVGLTFWSGRGHFFVIFGMSREVSGSGLGTLSDRFGKVWEKCPTVSESQDFQE